MSFRFQNLSFTSVPPVQWATPSIFNLSLELSSCHVWNGLFPDPTYFLDSFYMILPPWSPAKTRIVLFSPFECFVTPDGLFPSLGLQRSHHTTTSVVKIAPYPRAGLLAELRSLDFFPSMVFPDNDFRPIIPLTSPPPPIPLRFQCSECSITQPAE